MSETLRLGIDREWVYFTTQTEADTKGSGSKIQKTALPYLPRTMEIRKQLSTPMIDHSPS